MLGATQQCAESFGDAGMTRYMTYDLSAREGVTVAVGVAPGVLAHDEISAYQHWWQAYWPLAIPFGLFWALLYMWYTRGRDPKGRGTIIPRYTPPEGLTPIGVGTLVDEVVHGRDATAMMIDLAVRGYIRIEYREQSFLGLKVAQSFAYVLVRQKDNDTDLTSYEAEFLDAVFAGGRTERHIKNEMFGLRSAVQSVHKSVYAQLAQAGYFVKNLQHVRIVYRTAGTLFLFGTFAVEMKEGMTVLAQSLGASALVALWFAHVMPRKTLRGVHAREHLLGFKDFLMVTEKDRLAFHNAPEKRQELFEKFLPYAIALKVELAWAQQFDGIYENHQPTWLSGVSVSNATDLAKEMRAFGQQVRSMTAGSASSGGGGVGGGSGGGGGGSW